MAQRKVACLFDRKVTTWDQHYEDVKDIRSYEVIRRRDLVLDALSDHVSIERALVVEVGCGTGQVISSIIQARPSWHAIGCDISERMVHHCQELYGDWPNLSFRQHDIDDDPLPEIADVVLAIGVIGYLKRPERSFAHIHTMLRPGGYFLFTVNKPSVPRLMTNAYRSLRSSVRSRPREAEVRNKAFKKNEIERLLSERFQIVATRDYCYVPYVPGVRRFIGISKAMEYLFGRYNTLLSSTTLYIVRKLEGGTHLQSHSHQNEND